MGGNERKVKGNFGWLSNLFGSHAPAEPEEHVFSARDLYGLFFRPVLMLPVEHLGQPFLLEAARAMQTLMIRHSDKTLRRDQTFLSAYQDFIDTVQAWESHTPFVVGEPVLITLDQHIDSVSRMIDRATDVQRVIYALNGDLETRRDITNLQKEIRQLDHFNVRMQSLLLNAGIDIKSERQNRRARLEKGNAGMSFPAEWRF